MDFASVAEDFFTYDSRLASFQTAKALPKRRASNATTKTPKSIKWPHKSLPAEELAKAGFFFHPTATNLDNVVCFLCHKAVTGWEEGDEPLVEHLKLSPECGWAIVATIEAQETGLSLEYPLSEEMIEARKATFADRWPHDSKKGWKCKTKQLVDAGWKYTPTPEYDDMATCTYCSLALDGWEPADKPMDEHYKRSPECPFFALLEEHKQTTKKTKGKRVSKVSRLSTQSAITAAEDLSMIDLPAEEGDSILTTATTATAGGRKMTKGKKATAAKGKKTKAKKEEPVEIEDAPEPEDADFEVKVEPPVKATRGKKRKSDQVEESIVADVEVKAPPPKRRATRTRASVTVDDSVVEVPEEIQPKAKKGRVSRAKKNSLAPVKPVEIDLPNDEEIDQALEADLERQISESEAILPPPKKKATRGSKIVKADHAMFGVDSMQVDEAGIDAELEAMEEIVAKPLPKAKGAPKGKTARKPSAKQLAAAARKVAEEEAAQAAEKEQQRVAEQQAEQQILADLEESVSIQHSSPVLQPKKQRAAPKKVSKQQAARATKELVNQVDERNITMPGAFVDESKEDSGNETDASINSQATVVRGGGNKRGSTLKKVKGGKVAASKNVEIIQRSPTPTEEFEEVSALFKGKNVVRSEDVSMAEDFYTPAPEAPPIETVESDRDMDDIYNDFEEPDFESTPAARSPARPQIQQTLTAMVEHLTGTPAPPPSTTKSKKAKGKSPMPIARDPTPPPRESTASQSPQSSDAENHPPSSRPSLNKKTPTPVSIVPARASTPRTVGTSSRLPLPSATPTITRTPLQNISPSKRPNTISGLQSTAPWTAVDLDTLFLRDENGLEKALQKAKEEGLSSPEKKMTVQEWILYNAGLAEERLKSECEAMVSVFEKEGGRAMRALEGIEALE